MGVDFAKDVYKNHRTSAKSSVNCSTVSIGRDCAACSVMSGVA